MFVKQRRKLFCLKSPKDFRLVYVHGKGLSLFTCKDFKKGERVICLEGKKVLASGATPEAVQINEQYFLDTKYLVPGDFINHSCNPNTKVDMENRWFIAIKNIKRNAEITYNYLTTEWDMKAYGTDFKCRCGSRDCIGLVRGFKYLNKRQRKQLEPLLSPFLLSKLPQRGI